MAVVEALAPVLSVAVAVADCVGGTDALTLAAGVAEALAPPLSEAVAVGVLVCAALLVAVAETALALAVRLAEAEEPREAVLLGVTAALGVMDAVTVALAVMLALALAVAEQLAR